MDLGASRRFELTNERGPQFGTMDITLTAALICACFVVAVLSGMRIRRHLPDDHLSADTKEAVLSIWPQAGDKPVQLAFNGSAGDAFYNALQQLSPHDDRQRSLKSKAAALAEELAQMRTLLLVQSAPSISTPLLVVVVTWLVVIFLSFSLLAPPNATATIAMIISAFSVAGAIFLILQLDRPFSSVIAIPSAPVVNAMSQLAK